MAVVDSVEAVQDALRSCQYVADRRISLVVFLAEKLGKPVLVEGPAGVGKTELAKVVARVTGRRLVRLQCYEGLDERKALYEWEYGKQLLYTQILRDKIGEELAGVTELREAVARIQAREDLFFSKHFLLPRPLLQAIASAEPVVLLVDELDRADEEFEALLLEILSEFQVTIPEIGTVRAENPPLVFITSNNTRELSEALKRRCLHLFIDYPAAERELEIVRLKVPELREELLRKVVDFVRELRALDLRKSPSVSETLDWARALVALSAPDLDERLIEETLNILVKFETDHQRVRSWLRTRTHGGAPGPEDLAYQQNRTRYFSAYANPDPGRGAASLAAGRHDPHTHDHDHDHPHPHPHSHPHRHGGPDDAGHAHPQPSPAGTPRPQPGT